MCIWLPVDFTAGIEEEGIFRKSGNALRQRKLVESFNSGYECLKAQLSEDVVSPHDVAGLLKLFLRELPEPLLTSRPIVVYKKLAGSRTLYYFNLKVYKYIRTFCEPALASVPNAVC